MRNINTKALGISANFFPRVFRVFFILNALMFFPSLLDAFLYPRLIFLDVFLLFALTAIYFRYHPARITLTGILLFILSIIYLLSGLVAIYPGEAIFFFSKIISLALLFVITSSALEQNLLSRRDIIISLLIFGSVVALIASGQIVHYLFQQNDFFSSMMNVRSTVGNKNLLSIVLFWNITAGGLLLIEKKNYPLLLLVLISFALIVILYSRAVLLAIVAGISFAILLSFFLNPAMMRKFFPGTRVIATVAGLCILVSVILIVKKYQPFIFNTHSLDTRVNLFSNTLKMISDYWLTGVGGGNWQIYFPKYGLEKFQPETAFGYLTFQRPHNDFLWVFSETGIGGFAVYCFIFIYILYTITRKITNSSTKKDFYEANLLLFGIIGYIFIANFDFPLERIEQQELLMMFFVLAEHQTGNSFSRLKKFQIPKVLLPFLAIFICFSLTVSIFKMKGEIAIKKAFEYKQSAQWQSMIHEIATAENYFYRLDPFSMPVSWYAGVGYFTLDNMDSALKSFSRAYNIHPYNIHVMNNLAGTYARKGDYANAIHYYREALKISPKFSESLVNLSAVYYNKGDYSEAYRLIMSVPDTSTQQNYHAFKKAITESAAREHLH